MNSYLKVVPATGVLFHFGIQPGRKSLENREHREAGRSKPSTLKQSVDNSLICHLTDSDLSKLLQKISKRAKAMRSLASAVIDALVKGPTKSNKGRV